MKSRNLIRLVLCYLSFLGSLQVLAAGVENVSHLKGIHYFYMTVDTSLVSGLKPTERLDLNDIMELQLRRGSIALRPYIANQPEGNVPLVELTVETVGGGSAGGFELVLRVRDYVTIDRNQAKTVATIFELRRSASSGSGSKEIDALKAELRELMAEFVSFYRAQNP